MAFSLSFSPEFTFAEGEPYDRNDLALNSRGEPISVWSAIHWMADNEPTRWASMAREVFRCAPEHLTAETVLESIEATDTCTDLSPPVEVWIDRAGGYTVHVYGGPEAGER